MALGGNDARGSITANSGSSTAPAAGSTLALNTLGQSAGSVQVEGTFAGTLILEGTVSGSASGWRAITTTNMAGVVVTTMTAADIFTFDASRFSQVRTRSTAWTSGTAVLTMIAGPGSGGGSGGGGGGGGGAVTIADGADAALGTTTDAGITTNVAGTVIGFMRGTIIQWAAFLARLPAALVGGRLDVNVGATGVTQPVSGTVTANAGTGTFAVSAASLPLPTTAATDRATAAAPGSVELSDGAAFYTAAKTGQLPAALVGNRVDVNIGATGVTQPVSGTVTANQGTQGAGGTASWQVQGAAASAAAAQGNPVWVGFWDGATNIVAPTCGTPADGLGGSTGTQRAMALGYAFNGATMDRLRNNADVILLASAARTTLQNSANITTYNCRAIIVTVDVTATVSTVALTPSINYIDPASGKTIPLLTGVTIAAAGTTTYWVNMNAIVGTPAPFTKTVQADLGRVITINMAVGNANSQTYSIGYTLIPA